MFKLFVWLHQGGMATSREINFKVLESQNHRMTQVGSDLESSPSPMAPAVGQRGTKINSI